MMYLNQSAIQCFAYTQSAIQTYPVNLPYLPVSDHLYHI